MAMSAAVRFPDLATFERPLGPLPTAPDAPPVEVDAGNGEDVTALDSKSDGPCRPRIRPS